MSKINVPYKNIKDRKRYAKFHYQKNKDIYKKRARINTIIRRKKIRALIEKTKNVPCRDCGNEYPSYVMDLDHIKDKEFQISSAVSLVYSLSRVEREIKKCEIVCSNCHRKRTYRRRFNIKESIQ